MFEELSAFTGDLFYFLYFLIPIGQNVLAVNTLLKIFRGKAKTNHEVQQQQQPSP